jgi:hypothetical protein
MMSYKKNKMSVPRQTVINDQPHMLAYINPQEAMMLKSMGGAGKPGPGGVPAFYYGFDFGEAGRGKDDNSRDGGDAPQNFGYGDQTVSVDNDQGPSQADIDAANAANAAKAAIVREQQEAAALVDAQNQDEIDARREARKRSGIEALNRKNIATDPEALTAKKITEFYKNPMARPKKGIFSELVTGSIPGQIFQNIFNQKNIMRNKLQQQGNYSADGGFGIGSLMNKMFNTKAERQIAIRDQGGNVIGVVGFNEKGTPVSHTGQLAGFMDAVDYTDQGKGKISQGELVDFGQDNEFGLGLGPESFTSSDEGVDQNLLAVRKTDPCPEGFVLDPVTNTCVPISDTIFPQPSPPELLQPEPAPPPVVEPNTTTQMANVLVPTNYPLLGTPVSPVSPSVDPFTRPTVLFNQGGVASLNDVARNMSRGPRGIAGYETYMR